MELLIRWIIGLATWSFFGWLAWKALSRSLERSEDPVKLCVKWAGTLALAVAWAWTLKSLMQAGGYALGFLGPLITAAIGIIIGIIWAPSSGAMLARPLTHMFDGGDEPADPEPFYAVAMAKRKRGQYDLAMMEIRKQLRTFPADMQGHVMLAEILVEDLSNAEGAFEVLDQYLQNHELGAVQGAFVMNRLAEWEIRYRRNPEKARDWVRRIQEHYPDTEQAERATQKLAHMTDDAYLMYRKDPKNYLVQRHLSVPKHANSPMESAGDDQATDRRYQALMEHLQEHPGDTSAREELAWLYADALGAWEKAIEELRVCSAMEHQPAARLAKWHHQMADIHCRFTGNVEEAKNILESYIQSYPDCVHTPTISMRIKRLKLESRAALNRLSQPGDDDRTG